MILKLISLPLHRKSNREHMKYSELHRLLRKNGCYPTGETQAGHPLWFSPKTGKEFTTSHHEKQEVATGTLKSIKRMAGIN